MRILKRPMFRKGGSTGQGIMTGLVDRTKYAVGDRAKELAERELEDQKSEMDYSMASAQLAEAAARLKALQKLRKK